MILEAPFTSARDVSARVAPILGPLVVRGFNSRDKICRVHTPLLVIHGECDEVIGFDLGRKLFAAAREPKQFWAVPGASHEDIIETAGEQYRRRLDAFYVSVTPQG